jgi:hypothetical protein
MNTVSSLTLIYLLIDKRKEEIKEKQAITPKYMQCRIRTGSLVYINYNPFLLKVFDL